MKTVGQRLKWARKHAGFSARALAKAAGLKSSRHIGLIEDGLNNIASETAVRIADALGLSLDWFLRGQGPTPNVAMLRAVAAANDDGAKKHG